MAEIYLVRHGKTELNDDKHVSQDRIRAWKDVPLSEEGKQEAEKLGKSLKNKGIKYIYSSDLKRAKDTAECIGRYCKLKPKISEEYRPWDLGKFTGQKTEKVIEDIHKYVDTPDKKVPEGESFNDFSDRFTKGLSKIIRDHPKDSVALVTHHRNERFIKAWMNNGMPEDHEINFDVFKEKGEPTGKVEKINLDYNGKKHGNGDVLRKTIKDSVKEVNNGNSQRQRPNN